MKKLQALSDFKTKFLQHVRIQIVSYNVSDFKSKILQRVRFRVKTNIL